MTIPGFFEGTGMPDPGWWEALWPDPAKVLKDSGVAPAMEVVDLCSGDGWFTLQIGLIARQIFAVDIDGALLAIAKLRLAERGISNCSFVTGDAYGLATLIRSPVDHVFLANAFHGVPDKPRLAAAVHRVLKPGGLFAIVNWHARPRDETQVLGLPRGPATELRIDAEATADAARPAGFSLLRVVPVSPYHYGAVFERR